MRWEQTYLYFWLAFRIGLSFIQSLFFYYKKSWKIEKNVVFTKTGLQLDAHLHTYMPELVTAWYKVFHSTSKVKNNDFAGVCFCSYIIVTKLRLCMFFKKRWSTSYSRSFIMVQTYRVDATVHLNFLCNEQRMIFATKNEWFHKDWRVTKKSWTSNNQQVIPCSYCFWRVLIFAQLKLMEDFARIFFAQKKKHHN